MTSARWPGLLACAALFGVTLASATPGASTSALEQRLRDLEAKDDIRRLLVDYGEYLDAQDYPRYAALFAKDGVWTGGFGTAKGPAAIQTMLEKNMGKPAPGFINKTKFHLMTTMVIDVSGDTARARSRYMVMIAGADGRPVTSHAGRYLDELVRENGAWKIRSRATYGTIPYREPPAPGG